MSVFKKTYIQVFCAHSSEVIQRAMFKLGFRWTASGSGDVRELYLPFTKDGFLFVDEDCRITYNETASRNMDITDWRREYTRVWGVDLLRAAEHHTAAKKEARKESRKRHALSRFKHATITLTGMMGHVVADANGWTHWTGGDCPVAHGTLVDVVFRDRATLYSIPAKQEVPGRRDACNAFWGNDGWNNDIVMYRLSAVATPVATETLPVAPVIDTNPKRQYGLKSIPLNLWSPLASAYGALALYNGAGKYGYGNYKATPVEASIYLAACMRHLAAWAEGEEFDPKDGVPNLGGALANIAIILDARGAGTLIDDRQIRGGYLKEREALATIVESLAALHEGKTPRHYKLGDEPH